MNPINIAKGLLDKHDQVKDSAPEMAEQIRGDLAVLADDVREAVGELRGMVDPATIELEDGSRVPTTVAEEIRLTGRRLDELLGGDGASGGKRTTKAATPPNKTTS